MLRFASMDDLLSRAGARRLRRLGGRRRRRPGHGAGRLLPGPGRPDDGGRLADRRLGARRASRVRWATRSAASLCWPPRRRLVVGLRLFRRRPLVARRGLPGRTRARIAWALPFGVLGLPALLAFFPAFGFALGAPSVVAGPRPHPGSRGRSRLVGMAARACSSPASPGTIRHGARRQSRAGAGGSVVGLHGLTMLAVALCAAPATLADGRATLAA